MIISVVISEDIILFCEIFISENVVLFCEIFISEDVVLFCEIFISEDKYLDKVYKIYIRSIFYLSFLIQALSYHTNARQVDVEKLKVSF